MKFLKMKEVILKNIVFITAFFVCHVVNAQNFEWEYKDNKLKMTQHSQAQSLATTICFTSEDQLKIKGEVSSAVCQKAEEDLYIPQFYENNDEITLQSEQVKVLINKSTQVISIIRLPKELLWKGKLEFAIHPVSNEQIIQVISLDCSDEHFFGLGERLNGFDQKGKYVTMELSDAWSRSNEKAYKAVPFFMSSRNYGFLVNSPERIIFDMAFENPEQTKIIMTGMDVECIFFANKSPLKTMEQYTDITGKSPVIPIWSLEPWLSRRRHAGWNNTSYAKNELDQIEENGIHIGVVLWEGISRQFSIEQELPAWDLVDYWHNKGMKVVCWGRTGQIEDNPQNLLKYKYDKLPVKNYFVRDKNNQLVRIGAKGEIVNPDSGRNSFIYIDPSNPEAMKWWFKNIYAPRILADNGKSGPNGYNLDGIKIDFSELFPKDLKNYKTYKPTTGLANVHSVSFTEQVNSWLQMVKPEGGITWSRGGGIGLQRGGVFWNGDRMRNFAQLKGTVSSLLSVSVSGLAYAGHDLGGYMKGDDPEAEETYIRGVQFATFSPFFHDHGSVQAPREQNLYGRENYGFYTRVRYNLIPYLKGLITDANKLGWPIMRPLFFYYPNDIKAWNTDDQYFLGKDLLIAPILTKGTSRIVYLPAGDWIDFWTDEVFRGDNEILVNNDLNRIPVFIRKGAILPLALNENLEIGGEFQHADKNKLRLTYKLFSLESGISVLPANTEEQTILTINKFNGTTVLNLEGIKSNFAIKIPNTIPASIKVNGKTIVVSNENFKVLKQAWKYDSYSSELKIKIEAKKGVSTYKIELQDLPANEVTLLTGKIIAAIPHPKMPKILSIEPWDSSVDIVFDKDDALGEKYIIGYGFSQSLTATNRVDLNFGNRITINGLRNHKRYYFRVWAENQFYRSIETDWYRVVPSSEKKPIHNYSEEGLFIQANHFTEKTITTEGDKKYLYSVKLKNPATIKLWVRLSKHITHHDYNKWYEMESIELNNTDTITVEVPANHTLFGIFIAPDGINPFFKNNY